MVLFCSNGDEVVELCGGVRCGMVEMLLCAHGGAAAAAWWCCCYRVVSGRLTERLLALQA